MCHHQNTEEIVKELQEELAKKPGPVKRRLLLKKIQNAKRVKRKHRSTFGKRTSGGHRGGEAGATKTNSKYL